MPVTLNRPFVSMLLLGYLLGCLAVIAPAKAEETDSEVTVQLLKGSLSKTETAALTLEDALRMAQENNLGVKVAEDTVKQAKARYQTRLAEMLPDIQVTYGVTNFQGAIQPFGNLIFDVTRNSYQPQLLFRFPVFQGGRRLFQALSAKRTVEAEQATQQATLQQALQQTALSYYELQQRLDEIAIAQKQLDETQAHLEINQARMEAGAGTHLDVAQSQAQVARAKQNLLEAVRLSEVAALRLNEILDLSAFVNVVPAQQGQQMQTLVSSDTDFKQILLEAQKNRPELKAYAKQIAALVELRRVAWSAVLPEVYVQARTGGVGTNFYNTKHYDETGYGLNFVFKSLAVPAATLYKENSAQLDALRHKMEAQVNVIERQISESYLQVITRRAQVSTVRTELKASEDALTDAVERLKVGVGRNIDVLEAETSLTRARINLSNTIKSYNQAQVDLVYQMGLASTDALTKGIQLP